MSPYVFAEGHLWRTQSLLLVHRQYILLDVAVKTPHWSKLLPRNNFVCYRTLNLKREEKYLSTQLYEIHAFNLDNKKILENHAL